MSFVQIVALLEDFVQSKTRSFEYMFLNHNNFKTGYHAQFFSIFTPRIAFWCPHVPQMHNLEQQNVSFWCTEAAGI